MGIGQGGNKKKKKERQRENNSNKVRYFKRLANLCSLVHKINSSQVVGMYKTDLTTMSH
jgi:hypothetical protein